MPILPDPASYPPSEQGRLEASDGTPLAWYRWEPAGRPRGTICLTHGHGEHAGRYGHVADAFTRAGFLFLAFDLRGHGHSGGPRGHSPGYDQMLDDLGRVLALVTSRPCLAYGHSLGGQFVLNRVLVDPAGVDGVIATSPWLRLAFPAPALKVRLGRALYSVLPSFALPTGLEQAAISHLPEVVAAYAGDPLVHDRLSFRLGIDVLDGGERALAQAASFHLPLLLMHGAGDRLTDPAATREFYDRAGSADKTFRLWPELFHETHNEGVWEEVVAVSTSWARAHAN
ncbi:MAG TPA: lysophospholipase [Anaerolineales bacterium]|nr:lysophospholipase [Anaerolineales bacterium]